MKIALLEDNPSNCDYFEHLFRYAGYTVFTFHDGASFLAAMESGDGSPPYDLALIDLMLPGAYSGEEVLLHVLGRYSIEQLALIAMSAISQDELNRVQQRFPNVPVLRKPFKARTLFDLINLQSAKR